MKILKSLLITVVLISIVCLLIAAVLARNPQFNRDFFTSDFQAYYSSPEVVFNELWNARITGEKELYAAVLGRDLTGNELELEASPLDEKPTIQKVTLHGNSATILADDWGGSFEKIGGRWVFQNKEIGFYCRSLFRVFGIELARFL